MFMDILSQKHQRLIFKKGARNILGAKLDANHLDGAFFVRNVAPNKDMMRASFLLPEEVLFDLDVPESNKENDDERSGVKRAGSPDSSESLKKR
jgi:hypothetical protein